MCTPTFSCRKSRVRRVAGKTRRDRIRNDTIRNNLEVEALDKRIETILRWYGHAMRCGKKDEGDYPGGII